MPVDELGQRSIRPVITVSLIVPEPDRRADLRSGGRGQSLITCCRCLPRSWPRVLGLVAMRG
jgi:hypothetical protein